MESNIDENVILFDWLSFTSKQHTPQELISALGLSHLPFTELDTGVNGYNCRLYFDHIHVCYNGGNEDHGGMGVNVFMSGQGCRAFESNSTLKNKWMDLFGFIFSNNLNICRLDVAYDDHSGLLDIKRVCADTSNHLYISSILCFKMPVENALAVWYNPIGPKTLKKRRWRDGICGSDLRRLGR